MEQELLGRTYEIHMLRHSVAIRLRSRLPQTQFSDVFLHKLANKNQYTEHFTTNLINQFEEIETKIKVHIFFS